MELLTKNRFKRITALVTWMLLVCVSLSGCAGTFGNVSEKNSQSVDAGKLYFDAASGFYQSSFSLSISCSEEGARIFYTTDGSMPTVYSTEYTEPIELKDRSGEKAVLSRRSDYTAGTRNFIPADEFPKANVIRAVAQLPDGSMSEVINGTFFVGVNRDKLYGDVPIVSLISDPVGLVDYVSGIMVAGKAYDDWLKEDRANAKAEEWERIGNYSMRGRDWERETSFTFFPGDGSEAYEADLGMRIKGNATRSYVQKSYKLIARKEYGTPVVEYPLIAGNMRDDGAGDLNEYRSFVLRNGGNDADYAKLRDPLIQSLAKGLDVETQEAQLCVVFLNGEYWGMYFLTEDYSDKYFACNYGVEADDVIYIKNNELAEGEEEDLEQFCEDVGFLLDHDMTDPANYAKAGEMFDLQSLADYAAVELYIYNQDCVFTWDNNWAMWKTRGQDSKWKMVLYDTEFSSGIYENGENYDYNNLKEIFILATYGDHDLGRAFLSLYKNEDFKAMFIDSLCRVHNDCYSPARVKEKIAEMAPDVELLAHDQICRFGPDWVIQWSDPSTHTKEMIDRMQFFFDNRYKVFPRLLKDAFGVEFDVDADGRMTPKQ